MNKCIHCGADAPMTWFCIKCNTIKERSYAISKELNEKWYDILLRRDKMLKDSDANLY